MLDQETIEMKEVNEAFCKAYKFNPLLYDQPKYAKTNRFCTIDLSSPGHVKTIHLVKPQQAKKRKSVAYAEKQQAIGDLVLSIEEACSMVKNQKHQFIARE
jgi:hypothetical protein